MANEAESQNAKEIWHAGDLLIDVGAGTVCKESRHLDISGLSFDLLLALVSSAPSYLSHDELIDAVWKGRVVSPDTVKQRIKLLRDALGDDAAEARYIGLVRGRGYRFLPDVRNAQRVEAEVSKDRWRPRSYALAGLVIAFAAMAFYWLWPDRFATDPPMRHGIAVLPFESQAVDAGQADFFALGIHDDIITELANIEGLLVISRTSVLGYQGTRQSIREIGRTLNVDKILEGTVQQSANRLKINVQLIDVESDAHIWAQTYERELAVDAILSIQRQVAADIAGALHLSIVEATQPVKEPTASMDAYEHYFAARQKFNAAFGKPFDASIKDLLDAVPDLNAAITADPAFVEAHAYLSLVNSTVYYRSAKKEPDVLNAAVAALLEAVELDPGAARVHWAKGWYQQAIGAYEESLAEMELAAEGLPQESDLLTDLAARYIEIGRVDEAIALAEQLAMRDPLNFAPLRMLFRARIQLGDNAGALPVLRKMRELQPNNITLVYAEANTRRALDGDYDAFKEIVSGLPINDTWSLTFHYRIAMAERDFDKMIELLQAHPFEALEDRFVYRPYSHFLGQAYYGSGREDLAKAEFRRARHQLESVLANNPNDPRVLVVLAEVLAGLGEHQLARDTVWRVLDSPDYNRNMESTALWREWLISTLIVTQDHDKAIELLEVQMQDDAAKIKMPEQFLAEPRFDPLRDNPKFIAFARQFQTPNTDTAR